MTTALHIAGNTLDKVQSFKYLGAIISEEGSKPEVLARIAQATAALSSLKKIWRDLNITLRSKIRLLRSLVISIFLYACESWTLTADLQRRIQAMEMRCYRRLLNISYTEHITNVEVRNRIERAIGPYEDLLKFQRLPPARGGTAQKKIIHLANWSHLIHPGPASSLTKVFLVSSKSCVNADSLLILAAATSTSGTLNDLTTDLIMANNNNNNNKTCLLLSKEES